MVFASDLVSREAFVRATGVALLGALIWTLQLLVARLYFHPLSKFPGPKLAAATVYYKAWIECYLDFSWHLQLEQLHARYGPVVRVGPDELHFAEPQAYHDIHNNSNRWDKERRFYHSFGEDESSFGFLRYKDSRERKDAMASSFSQKTIYEARSIVQDQVDMLCARFEEMSAKGKAVNISYAWRCMAVDIITYYCFGKSVDAIRAPGFGAPIVLATEAAVTVFLRFKHFRWYMKMITGCPRPLARIIAPESRGLIDVQEIIEKQIRDLSDRPERLGSLPHRMTIYHQLLSPESYRNGTAPTPRSLYDESQVMIFAGSDTVANTLTVGTYHILQLPEALKRLQDEIRQVYPDPSVGADIKELERLPYLNAFLKESLRMSIGVTSGLPRIVPAGGAKIAGREIPQGTIVAMAATMVHFNADIFPNPYTFDASRWIGKPELDNWLVAFSRGPRSCLGINLAWMELRLAAASVFRRFELSLDASAPKEMVFRDAFVPNWLSAPPTVNIKNIKA